MFDLFQFRLNLLCVYRTPEGSLPGCSGRRSLARHSCLHSFPKAGHPYFSPRTVTSKSRLTEIVLRRGWNGNFDLVAAAWRTFLLMVFSERFPQRLQATGRSETVAALGLSESGASH